MALEIAVGPPVLSINYGHTVLVTEPDGQIKTSSEQGLYFFDTRLISTWQMFANGVPWELLNSGNLTYHTCRIFLTNHAFLTESGEIPARTISFVLSRSVEGGMHEDLDVTNHNAVPVRFNLEISIRSDFADIFEAKAKHIVRRGRITTDWAGRPRRLRTTYRNGDFHRAITVTPQRNRSAAVFANGRISFAVEIEPGETWHSCLEYGFVDADRHFPPPHECVSYNQISRPSEALQEWKQGVLKIRTSNEEFYRLYKQSIEDMAGLRLPIEGTDHICFVPAAGVPWFVALFGRDSLIVSLQNALVHPDFARGALEVLGQLQATEIDDYRDAQPGKIPHELRFGELAHFKLVPHTPYYGTADATPLYLIVLHMAWRSTGDRSLLEGYRDTAERCLEWIDRYGDLDGDGFQEYQARSPTGYENQGWKDSGEAVVYPDGSLVKGSKALCELQGYVYDAWLRMADIYDVLDDDRRAQELRRKAETLFDRFNEAFWDEELGTYAYGLDGDKKRIRTIVSNPGHCLWSGIVPKERAGRVVARLLEPDMWCGWGIRTLSALNPAYNPHSYQNGSVWPHDNAIIAMGCKRYGYASEAARIARAISGAAGFFILHRLPELYAGLDRDGASFPVQYLGANVPQAWAAGSVFWLLQAIIGFQPDAPAGKLYVDPVLPAWLPDLTVIDLCLGDQSFDIEFRRDGQETLVTVLKGDERAVERRSIAVESEQLKGGRVTP